MLTPCPLVDATEPRRRVQGDDLEKLLRALPGGELAGDPLDLGLPEVRDRLQALVGQDGVGGDAKGAVRDGGIDLGGDGGVMPPLGGGVLRQPLEVVLHAASGGGRMPPPVIASTLACASSRRPATGRSVSMVSMTSWSITLLMGCQTATRGRVLA